MISIQSLASREAKATYSTCRERSKSDVLSGNSLRLSGFRKIVSNDRSLHSNLQAYEWTYAFIRNHYTIDQSLRNAAASERIQLSTGTYHRFTFPFTLIQAPKHLLEAQQYAYVSCISILLLHLLRIDLIQQNWTAENFPEQNWTSVKRTSTKNWTELNEFSWALVPRDSPPYSLLLSYESIHLCQHSLRSEFPTPFNWFIHNARPAHQRFTSIRHQSFAESVVS